MRPRVRRVAALVGPDHDLGLADPGDQTQHIAVTEHPPSDEGDPGQLAPLHGGPPRPPERTEP